MPLTPPIVANATLGRQDGTPLWEERMTRIIDFFFFALKVAIALLLAGMVVLVFGNVVLRYAFNQGITVSEELSRIFFVWVTFLGAVVAMREHGHLGVDTVIKRLPPLAARLAVLSGYALMLFATWLMISGSWAQTLINLHVGAPATGLSMGFFYGAGLAFGVPAFLILLADAFAIATGRIDVTTAELVRDSEDEMALDDLPEPVLGPAGTRSSSSSCGTGGGRAPGGLVPGRSSKNPLGAGRSTPLVGTGPTGMGRSIPLVGTGPTGTGRSTPLVGTGPTGTGRSMLRVG